MNKNISRINGIQTEKNIWPNFKKVTFKTEIKNGLSLNQIIRKKDPKTAVCWDVPSICKTSNYENIDISRSKFGYLFIYKFKN